MAEDPSVAMRQLYTSRIVTIDPGVKVDQNEDSAKSTITIHEGVLRQHSPFFRAMLDKHWKEGGTGVVNMPEDRSDVLIAYVNWLYTNVIPPFTTGPSDDYGRLARLYVFGEKIQDDAFCEQVTTVITKGFDSFNYRPSPTTTNLIYSGTPAGSPIRQLLLETYSAQSLEDWFDGDCLYNAEFMNDLAKQFVRDRGQVKTKSWHDQRSKWFKQK